MIMDDSSKKWYALKVFFNRVFQIEEYMKQEGGECYVPTVFQEKVFNGKRTVFRKPAVASLMFVRVDDNFLLKLKDDWQGKMLVYYDIATHQSKPIPDEEMNAFIYITSKGFKEIDYIPEDGTDYKTGEHVIVTGGQFEGAEGYIKRVKGDKRLIVAIEGVVAVATTYIPRCFLKKITD